MWHVIDLLSGTEKICLSMPEEQEIIFRSAEE